MQDELKVNQFASADRQFGHRVGGSVLAFEECVGGFGVLTYKFFSSRIDFEHGAQFDAGASQSEAVGLDVFFHFVQQSQPNLVLDDFFGCLGVVGLP